jgi:hypothetical protein
MPSPEFELATVEVEKVNGVVSNDDLLLVRISEGLRFRDI